MKVKLVRDWAGHGAGSVVDVDWDDAIARMLVERGYAERVEPEVREVHRPDASRRRVRKLSGGRS